MQVIQLMFSLIIRFIIYFLTFDLMSGGALFAVLLRVSYI